MQGAVRAMQPRSAIGVVTAPGDRRDSDIQELAVIAADTFDTIIVREDEDLRGRAPGEVAQLITDTIIHHRPSLPVQIIPDEAEAIDAALEMARPNDVVVLFIDKVAAAIEQVKTFAAAVAAADPTAFACSIGNDPDYMQDVGIRHAGNGKESSRDGFVRSPGADRQPSFRLVDGEDRP
jgi:UDP-N-acetylmuramyl tripeptide synthase